MDIFQIMPQICTVQFNIQRAQSNIIIRVDLSAPGQGNSKFPLQYHGLVTCPECTPPLVNWDRLVWAKRVKCWNENNDLHWTE